MTKKQLLKITAVQNSPAQAADVRPVRSLRPMRSMSTVKSMRPQGQATTRVQARPEATN